MCSESPSLASTLPYLLTPEDYDDGDGLHLIVCVHGLDGQCQLLLFADHVDLKC